MFMLTEKSPIFTPSVKFSFQNVDQTVVKPEANAKASVELPQQKEFILVGKKVNRN